MNTKMKKIALATIIAFSSVQFLYAKEDVDKQQHRVAAPGGGNQIAASCSNSTSRKDLDINNIRCPIFINGDMWWDLLGAAQYEVPKDSKKYSLFAGALWIGGYDLAGNLKVAAQTYRQSGSDFWPGPVDTSIAASITADVCNAYDRHWRVTRAEVEAFAISRTANHTLITPSLDIQQWGNYGDGGNHARYLAPFHDANGDGSYSYLDGDYPGYNLNPDPTKLDSNSATNEYLLGDQTLWWVFNDVGNVHKETGGAQIGLEIQAQAFAFATNDEINNMTFYKYKIINRSSLSVNKTYFGAWVDPDLGNYLDDYVGCDVKRGFGYCYNGDAYDEGITGYGFNPPAIGYDFFQGPKADIHDGLDNDRDGCIDCTWKNINGVRTAVPDSVLPELIIMSKFVYYNNNSDAVSGNPTSALNYYNYMQGIWRNGSKITYGGNGHLGGLGSTTDTCDFMFPGDSDPSHWGTHGKPEPLWDEVTAGNAPDDRRFLQSAGPFTLQPGAVNFITTGAVWGRAASGGRLASVQLIRIADDKAQHLFDHDFAITNGPDAPDLSIRELDQELLFSISNPNPAVSSSNNYPQDENHPGVYHDEAYTEIDPNLTIGTLDKYKFQGYEVFQLKDPTVTTLDLLDVSKARLVFQCDIKDGIGQIVNYYRDPNTTAYFGVEQVNGADNGLRHVFRLNKDKFATGSDQLINHKTYYYTVIAYAFDSLENAAFDYTHTTEGDGKPFLSGRRRIQTYTAIPHKIAPEANGLILNTTFGDGPEITRIEGTGNGYIPGADRQTLDLTQESVDNIITNTTTPGRMLNPVYQRAKGPVDIRVYDPVNIVDGDFQLWTEGLTDTCHWYLKNKGTGEVLKSTQTIAIQYDQLVEYRDPNSTPSKPAFIQYGIYVNMTQLHDQYDATSIIYPGDQPTQGAGFIEATRTFDDPTHKWLSGVPDRDNIPAIDWIASGKDAKDYQYNNGASDGTQTWEKLLGGTWAPYKFVSRDSTHNGPAYNNITVSGASNKFKDQASVDVVFTSDQNYWSKCMVLEEQPTSSNAIGGAVKCKLRKSPSLNKNLVHDPSDSTTGFSYFPGYAINVETGERLNIAFGEDSYEVSNNGADMKWNPTSNFVDDNGNFVLGGKHVVYVFAHNADMPLYDGCSALASKINNGSSPNIRLAWGSCMWVGYPMLATGESLLSNKATVRIRVARPYEKYQTDSPAVNNNLPLYEFSTHKLVPKTNDLQTAKDALDLINIVPNPYYAFSSYEKNQLENRVKITNLPSRCTISIYTPNGTLVRRLSRDVSSNNTSEGVYPETNLETALDWDLKNTAGIPIASGVYLIHVDAPGIGEKTIKWFGVLRPIDLDTF